MEFCTHAEKFGAAFTLVKADVGGNINRLKTAQARDLDQFVSLFPIILDEVTRKEQEGRSSDTNGLLWLKR